MRTVIFAAGIVGLAACAPAPDASQSNHLNLDVKECQRLAKETFAKGELNYNLCPGYAPDGQKIELF